MKLPEFIHWMATLLHFLQSNLFTFDCFFVSCKNATEKQKIVSIFGFNFELKAVRNCERRGSYSFMIQVSTVLQDSVSAVLQVNSETG